MSSCNTVFIILYKEMNYFTTKEDADLLLINTLLVMDFQHAFSGLELNSSTSLL